MVEKHKPNEIYIERIYDAPVNKVWDAWVDPVQVGQWWGPRGFTITNESKDVKTGGHWNYVMHGPDGVNYPNKTQYLEVEKYHKMVYDHGGNDEQKPLFRVTVYFEELGGKTKMKMSMALATEEAATETKKFIKKVGGNTTWDRLGEYLELTSRKTDIFVINETFDCSIDLMFDVWTNTHHLGNWMGPTGSKVNYLRADIKSGGSAFYCMIGHEGQKIYGKANYLEIVKPNYFIYTQFFCDENEKIIPNPMSSTWPKTMKTTITMNSESLNKTRVDIRWEINGEASPIERETFNRAKAGMSQGWSGSFSRLEDYLIKLSN